MSARTIPALAGLLALIASQVVAPAAVAAVTTADYYEDARGRSGESLKDALNDIVSTGAVALPYPRVWDALKVTDEDPADPSKVVLVYSGTSRAKSRNGGSDGDWNREHVWPKSHGGFGTARGPGTDLHHLRPEDVEVNRIRGNKDFDRGGEVVEQAPGNRTDDDSWEPRDGAKGDVARMIFYMAVRYEGEDRWPDLEADDAVLAKTGKPRTGRVSVLLRWHEQDPVDAFERRRNELIFERYQRNRNPFIDHPEWVSSIFGR